MADNNNIQEKAIVPDRVLDRSVQSQVGFTTIPGDNSFVLQMSTVADDIIPWGRNVWRRDRELRSFWVTEPYVASAINTIVAARANMSWSLNGPPRTVAIIQRMFQSSNLGKGWLDLHSKVAIDLLTQDNAGFVEIIRQEDKPTSPVMNLNHLDSGRCVRTGMSDFPVIYYDRENREHKLAWYQVMTFEDMSSPIEEMNSVQYCFLTRILRGAQILRDISVFKREKLSGRNPGQIHLVSGVQTKIVDDKLEIAQENATNQGFARYMLPLVIGSLDPTANVSAVTIDLKSLPEGFEEDTTMRWYISLLAMGAGADYQDFAPLSSGSLGSGQQSETLHRKARGKGHFTWRKLWEHKLNFSGIMPQSVTFSFDENDIAVEAEQADLDQVKAETFNTYYNSGVGVLPLSVIHQMMADEEILKPEYLAMLGGENVTTDIIATDDEPSPTQAEIADATQPQQTEEVATDEIPAEVRAKDSKDDISYGWCGLQMPPSIKLVAFGIASKIKPDDLHEIGIEDDTHVTVKYGFEDGVTSEMVAQKSMPLLPVTMKFGKLSLFKNDEFEVLKVEVESEKLQGMHRQLSNLPNVDNRPKFNPHMTIAYLKPGRGKQYIGDNPLNGRFVQVNDLQFSDKNENRQTILGLKKKQIDDDVTEYEELLQELAEDALNDRISQAEFLDEAGILVAQQVLLAFLEGSEKTTNQLTDRDREVIDLQTDENLDALPQFYNDILGFEGNEEPEVNIENRVRMWGNSIFGVFTLGILHGIREGQHMAWVLGATDHCDTCLDLSTIVATRAEWRDSGWHTQSRELDCHGYRCQCRIVETENDIQGSFP